MCVYVNIYIYIYIYIYKFWKVNILILKSSLLSLNDYKLWKPLNILH